jgi:protein-tyrosine phosphatase
MIGAVSDWFLSYGFADVHDELLVGAYPVDVSDVKTLQRLGVRRILNLVEDAEYAPGQREEVVDALHAAGIEETRMKLEDYGHLPLDALEAAVQQIVTWQKAGERSYVHCRAGWQRSAAVAAGVVAILDGVDVETALSRVRTRKPSANPLPHQREDLLRWWHTRDPDPARDADPSGAGR